MPLKNENPCLIENAANDPDHWYITKIRNPLDPEAADEIAWPIPTNEEECQARYNVPLSFLIRAGVVNLSTRPDYTQSGYEGRMEGKKFIATERKENAQQLMQELADAYQPGRTAPATGGVKAKAKKVDELKAVGMDENMTEEDFLAKARAMGLLK